jgi:hypothetical protein
MALLIAGHFYYKKFYPPKWYQFACRKSIFGRMPIYPSKMVAFFVSKNAIFGDFHLKKGRPRFRWLGDLGAHK